MEEHSASEEVVETLICLQQVDEEVLKASADLVALPKRITDLEERLGKRKKAVNAAETRVREEEVTRRRLEGELRFQQIKLEKFKAQTDSVRNNEQYVALQHEITFTQDAMRAIEDQQLDSMQRAEDADAALKIAKEEEANQQAQLEADRKQVAILIAEKKSELVALRKEQLTLRAAMDADLLAKYDRIASTRKTGAARATHQKCSACQMQLRPQAWNAVRAGSLMNCESCGRILFFNAKLEPRSEGGSGALSQSA
jgi:predicted  nucleic acid-binding Zn-ribbon protein